MTSPPTCEKNDPASSYVSPNKADASAYSLVGNNLKVSSDYVFFANLNLSAKDVEAVLMPYMELIGQRIAFTYKSPAKISFQGINGIFKLKLSLWLQFDDLCIKLLHVNTGTDVLITLNTEVARLLLIRLLSTTLIDDAHGVLFSSTEKGILSFVIARLLLDLKHTLGDKMPDLKLLGIYHCQDESINDTAIADYGVFNFSFTFAHDSYPVSIALPLTILHSIKPVEKKIDLIPRSGHYQSSMKWNVAKLSVTRETVSHLSFGDLILFEKSTLHVSDNRLQGVLAGVWQGITIFGELKNNGDDYVFSPSFSQDFARIEDIKMEELNISGAHDDVPRENNRNRKLADLAKNIRVPLSIELASIPLTLKELCQIREGEIIDLHRKIDDPLDMVVEGKIIGHCQPVQIDGRLGIRVLSIDGESSETSV